MHFKYSNGPNVKVVVFCFNFELKSLEVLSQTLHLTLVSSKLDCMTTS